MSKPANLIAKEIVQRVIGPHVVFELRGGITAMDTLHASHIIEAMEAYHAAAMAEVRKEIDSLVADTMKKMQKAEKDSIESMVFAARALAFGDVQNIFDAHKPKT